MEVGSGPLDPATAGVVLESRDCSKGASSRTPEQVGDAVEVGQHFVQYFVKEPPEPVRLTSAADRFGIGWGASGGSTYDTASNHWRAGKGCPLKQPSSPELAMQASTRSTAISGTAPGETGAMDPSVEPTASARAPRTLRLGEHRYPVVLPDIRDPRLHLAAVIISIHILGQVALGFRVSVPQILAAILTCAVIELTWTLVKKGTIVWPASAMLTGSGVALILRVVGTESGDH